MKPLCFWIVILMVLSSCKNTIEYKISDNYVGPCVVFIYQNNSIKNDSNNIVINEGLGRINSNKMSQKFIFKSIENNHEIPPVEIGHEETVVDNQRYIFGISKNTLDSKCDNKDLNTVTFFVGGKTDYLKWSDKYHNNELNYFDSKGIEWCNFYKALDN